MQFPDTTITALIGQAVGDAFGSPFEFHAAAANFASLSVTQERYLDGLDCRLPPRRCRTPGLYTDDTQQALILFWIWSQMVSKGRDPKDAEMAAGLFIRVCRKMSEASVPPRSPSFGVHRGTGRNFRDALLTYPPPDTAGLGAAMRVGPIATLLEPSEVLAWVSAVSQMTTSSPIAQAGAAMFALRANTLARNASEPTTKEIGLDLMPPEFVEAWWKLDRACEVMAARGEEGLLEFATKTGASNKPLHEAANGFALTGVPWVLGCVEQGSSFSDTLLRVCSSGGDTDTVAAMAGCLAALRFGRSDIPPWMLDGLVGRDHLLDPVLWHPVGTERQYAEMDTQVLLAAEQRVQAAHASRKKPQPKT